MKANQRFILFLCLILTLIFSGCKDTSSGNGASNDAGNNISGKASDTILRYPGLTVSVVGNGRVDSSSGGIACGTDCNEGYVSGTSIIWMHPWIQGMN